MVLFRCVIDVETHKVKKNGKSAFFNKKTGKAWVTRDRDAIVAENFLVDLLTVQKNRQLYGHSLTGELHVKLVFYFKDFYTVKMQRNRRIPDLDNLFCLPLDALTKAGVIEDDNQIASLDGSRRRPGERNSLEIVISAFVE